MLGPSITFITRAEKGWATKIGVVPLQPSLKEAWLGLP